MPRFQDEHIAALKRAMLPRLPACYFTQEDVAAVQQETGLEQAQIEFWAKNLRFRLPREEDRAAFLRAEGEQEKVRHVDPGCNVTKCQSLGPRDFSGPRHFLGG